MDHSPTHYGQGMAYRVWCHTSRGRCCRDWHPHTTSLSEQEKKHFPNKRFNGFGNCQSPLWLLHGGLRVTLVNWDAQRNLYQPRVMVIAFTFSPLFPSTYSIAEKGLTLSAFVTRAQRRKRSWWAPRISRAAGTTRSRWICWRKRGPRTAGVYNSSPAIEFHGLTWSQSICFPLLSLKKLNSNVSTCYKSESPLIPCHKKMAVPKGMAYCRWSKIPIAVHHSKSFSP